MATTDDLKEAIRDVLGSAKFRSLPEDAALEAALELADEWRMRLDELREDD